MKNSWLTWYTSCISQDLSNSLSIYTSHMLWGNILTHLYPVWISCTSLNIFLLNCGRLWIYGCIVALFHTIPWNKFCYQCCCNRISRIVLFTILSMYLMKPITAIFTSPSVEKLKFMPICVCTFPQEI